MKHPTILVPILALALSVGGAATVAAQYPPAQGNSELPPAQRRMRMLLDGIMLTAAQKSKIDSIQIRYAQQIPAMNPGSPHDSASMDAIRIATDRQDAEIRAVLTPEQQETWDRNKESLTKQRGS